MRITKQISERHNLGNYEHIDITVGVEIDVEIERVAGEDDEFFDLVNAILDDLAARERQMALQLTCNKNAVIKEHPALRRN